jgi:hypothetical protein
VRELRYTDNNAAIGVPMMQKMGMKYLMVFTQAAKDQADTRSDLTLIATSGPWKIYLVADSNVVEPLTVQPVVVRGRGGDQRERHLELGTSWFQHTTEWAAMPADDGPPEWQRIDVQVDLTRRVGTKPLSPGRKVDIVVPKDTIVPKQLPAITVSNYHMGVLVKVSYFPNWEVSGAKGPYRVAPNFMVVVPTSTHVRLHYEASTSDKLAYLVTLIGIGLLVFWRIRGDVRHRSPHPFIVAPDHSLWTPAEGWGEIGDEQAFAPPGPAPPEEGAPPGIEASDPFDDWGGAALPPGPADSL